MPSPRRWASLAPSTKKAYQKQGISSILYNRYWDKTPAARGKLDQAAKAGGYTNGLQFSAVESAVRLYAEKKITPVTPPRQAALMLLEGSERASPRRAMVPRLFHFKEFERVEWEQFLSP
jgi:hypothetical protein